MLIYKLLRAAEWAALVAEGETMGAAIDIADGYVHFSTADQVEETARRYFAGLDGVMLLAFESTAMADTLRWEPSRGGALFPHLYGPLRLSDALWAEPLPLFENAHVFSEPIAGYVDPSRHQFDAFKGFDGDHPIEMLNLVRLRTLATYPDGHASAGASGADAYAAYGRETLPVLRRVGGEIVWRGAFETMVIGPNQKRWDRVFVARYPTAHAFLAMVADPIYRSAVVHRQAAVRTSRLIRCMPAHEPGSGFG